MKTYSRLLLSIIETFRTSTREHLSVAPEEVIMLIDVFAVLWVSSTIETERLDSEPAKRDYDEIVTSLRFPGYDTSDPLSCAKKYRSQLAKQCVEPVLDTRQSSIVGYGFAVARVIELLYQRYDMGAGNSVIEHNLNALTSIMMRHREIKKKTSVA